MVAVFKVEGQRWRGFLADIWWCQYQKKVEEGSGRRCYVRAGWRDGQMSSNITKSGCPRRVAETHPRQQPASHQPSPLQPSEDLGPQPFISLFLPPSMYKPLPLHGSAWSIVHIEVQQHVFLSFLFRHFPAESSFGMTRESCQHLQRA